MTRDDATIPAGRTPAPGQPVRTVTAHPRQQSVNKSPRSTILVVDDEPEICDLVRYNLTREGYRVLVEQDGEAGLDRIFKSPPDLVVLDLLLPKLSGLEVLRAVRGEPRTKSLPVLVLTARSTEMDKLLGFERGADDYLTKPFSPRELVARMKAVLRRTDGRRAEDVLTLEDVVLDRNAREVSVEGRAVELTTKEFDLLAMLIENPGVVVSRDQLLDRVWGMTYPGGTRTVDVHVAQLRRKLGKPELIRTVRGAGYKTVRP
jgi:two-component system, OmpR family, alkaline phosphatase synthesis response regulator PhoP